VCTLEGLLCLNLFVDDLAIEKDLSHNERAAAIYRENYPRKHSNFDPESMPYVAAPAVLFDESVWFCPWLSRDP
jgi:hypothetical protein